MSITNEPAQDEVSGESPRELVRRAREGERAAFADLVRMYQRPVRGFLGRLLHDPHMADDAAQEVFLEAFRHLAAYQESAPFLSWLLGIARHRAISQLRSAARRMAESLGGWEAELIDARLLRADEAVADAEHELRRLAALESCLAGLAPASRSLVEAFYFQGQTAESLAAALERRANAVRMTLLRIRKALGECIEHKLQAKVGP